MALPAGSRGATSAECTCARQARARDSRAPLPLAEDAHSYRQSSNARKNALIAKAREFLTRRRERRAPTLNLASLLGRVASGTAVRAVSTAAYDGASASL
jgi:hypothetical protein